MSTEITQNLKIENNIPYNVYVYVCVCVRTHRFTSPKYKITTIVTRINDMIIGFLFYQDWKVGFLFRTL